MTKRKNSPVTALSQSKPSKQSKSTDSAFDIWLNRGLHQLFDEVAHEPIPPELLRLIEEDDQK